MKRVKKTFILLLFCSFIVLSHYTHSIGLGSKHIYHTGITQPLATGPASWRTKVSAEEDLSSYGAKCSVAEKRTKREEEMYELDVPRGQESLLLCVLLTSLLFTAEPVRFLHRVRERWSLGLRVLGLIKIKFLRMCLGLMVSVEWLHLLLTPSYFPQKCDYIIRIWFIPSRNLSV